jgi:DNA-binding NtrC family response regulator
MRINALFTVSARYPCAPPLSFEPRSPNLIGKPQMTHVLLVDDDQTFTPVLSDYIMQQGLSVNTAHNLSEARALLDATHPDLLLVDLSLPDGSGLDLLQELKDTRTRVVVLTGYPSFDTAVYGLRANVDDYLTKPVDMARLRVWLKGPVATHRAPAADLPAANDAASGRFGPFVGASRPMQELYKMMEMVAPNSATVFLQGESGTGKDLAAGCIHDLSRRAKQPFLALNCGAVPEKLIGNELFGHERGGYTGAIRQHKGYFERANGGTLFLDEITEMPVDLQVNLLRVLETGKLTRLGGYQEIEVDVRLIAATNRDPKEAVSSGKLREDLYYRLMVFPLTLPPLRFRSRDVELLAHRFLAALNEQYDDAKRLTPAALDFVATCSWPGNVRELKNAVERAYIIADDDIDARHFSHLREAAQYTSCESTPLRLTAGMSLEEAERNLIFATLDELSGNKRLAAESLGISLKTLYNKLKRYQIH